MASSTSVFSRAGLVGAEIFFMCLLVEYHSPFEADRHALNIRPSA